MSLMAPPIVPPQDPAFQELYLPVDPAYVDRYPDFAGYDVFYKLYPKDSELYTGLWTPYRSFLEAYEGEWDYVQDNYADASLLRSLGYHHLNLDQNLFSSSPVLKIFSQHTQADILSQGFMFYVSFTELLESSPSSTAEGRFFVQLANVDLQDYYKNGERALLYRDVLDSAIYQPFSTLFHTPWNQISSSNDLRHLPSSVISAASVPFFEFNIVFYAIAYAGNVLEWKRSQAFRWGYIAAEVDF